MGYVHKSSNGKTYYLHRGKFKFPDGDIDDAWYFSTNENPHTTCDLPDNRIVRETDKGIPILLSNKYKGPERIETHKFKSHPGNMPKKVDPNNNS